MILRRFIIASLGGLYLAAAIPRAHAQEVSDSPETAEETEAPARPEQTPEERAALVAWLRESYSRPTSEWPAPTLDEGRPHHELASIKEPPSSPADNPQSEAKARLGLSLFFDPRLSRSQQISCSSCHEPQLGWSNGIAFSVGVNRRPLKRNPPTLIGTGYHTSFFWDGRAKSLEDQARAVILNPDEMNANPEKIVQRLQHEERFYGPLFEKAFGDATVTFTRIVQALAAFERTIRAGRTRFDRFVEGKYDVLTDSELSGLHTFRTKARCLNCHGGPMLTDNEFHNLGLTYYGRRFQDLGLYDLTGQPEDVGKFRTPTLRNIDRTGPYMHNGVFPSLEGVLRLYNAGMPRPKPKEHQKDDPLFPVTSPFLHPLGLDARELADLRAFLSTLTEPPTRVLMPPVPPIRDDAP